MIRLFKNADSLFLNLLTVYVKINYVIKILHIDFELKFFLIKFGTLYIIAEFNILFNDFIYWLYWNQENRLWNNF